MRSETNKRKKESLKIPSNGCCHVLTLNINSEWWNGSAIHVNNKFFLRKILYLIHSHPNRFYEFAFSALAFSLSGLHVKQNRNDSGAGHTLILIRT